MAPITLYFLQASRAIRIAWLLEELGLDYNVDFSPRENNRAPVEFQERSGSVLGKFPVLKDGDLTIHDSGAITDYLLDTYDTDHKLLPEDRHVRAKVRQWIHIAEGIFMLHCIPITFARWNLPESAKSDGSLEILEKSLGVNVQKDLDYLELELGKGNGKFLVGDSLTAADTMMAFSAEYILERKLGTGERKWENVERWLKGLEGREEYKRAVKKSGYTLKL